MPIHKLLLSMVVGNESTGDSDNGALNNRESHTILTGTVTQANVTLSAHDTLAPIWCLVHF